MPGRAVLSALKAAAVAVFWVGAAWAGPAEDMLRDLLSAPARAGQFAPTFLDAVPLERAEAILAELRSTVGDVDAITLDGDRATVLTATHRLQARIALDANGRVAMLFVEPPVPLAGSLGDAVSRLARLAETVAVLVIRDGTPLTAHDAEVPLPVASAFKLGVLDVLRQDVEAGRRAWSDVVILEDRHRSLPTGDMRLMPPGSPVTLHTLAFAMIAASDNTATDALIATLGRERIADALGLDHLLTTREVFGLMARPDLRAAWLAGDSDKTEIAARAAATLPAVSDIVSARADGIGWKVSLSRLCKMLERNRHLPLFSADPGPLGIRNGQEVAFKGGSLAGVLNFTSLATDEQGRTTCIAVTFNDPGPIDEAAAVSAYRALGAAALDR